MTEQWRGGVRLSPETCHEWKTNGIPEGVTERLGRQLIESGLSAWKPGASIKVTCDVRLFDDVLSDSVGSQESEV